MLSFGESWMDFMFWSIGVVLSCCIVHRLSVSSFADKNEIRRAECSRNAITFASENGSMR